MDRTRGIVTLAFIYVFIFSSQEIHPVDGNRYLLTEHVSEIMNKTYHDDVYDCVDFYKQPAFDHPLLANHTFHHEMRPSSIPKLRISKTNISLNMEVQFKGLDCPIGTVPIKRVTTEDRIRERLHLEKYGSDYNLLTAETPGIHYATAKTKPSPTQKYKGAGAEISIWNPFVQNSQYSSGQLIIRNGHDNMQFGWTVNSTLYGDNRARSFIFTSSGATKCFNTHCPGFVIVKKNILIGSLLPGSTKGGPTYVMNFKIQKDAKDGNWWLIFGTNFEPLGFWPKNIFTSLADVATSVEWGGQVYSPPDVPSPPMGSGSVLTDPTPTIKVDAYCGFLTTTNDSHVEVDAVDIDVYADTPSYKIKLKGYTGEAFGRLLYFGGPGGVTENLY